MGCFQTQIPVLVITFISLCLYSNISVSGNILEGYARCREHCDKHRRLGWKDKFQLDCRKKYATDEELQQCKSYCSLCPTAVCNPSEPNLFNCPATNISDKCTRRCDAKREKGSLDGYVMKCDQSYKTYWDVEDCQSDCKHCPEWICNARENSNVFYCPTGDYSGLCKRDCEYHRRQNYGNIEGKFLFRCSEFLERGDGKKCRNDCKNCPLMICNANEDHDVWTCPTLSNPRAIRHSDVTNHNLSNGKLEDKYFYFGMSVATKLRSMDANTSAIAEEKISQILVDVEYKA